MESAIIFIHVIAAIAITGLVLIQQGKGADMGASFGSGASQTIFGSSGSGNVLTKSTSIMAAIFFITSMGLAIIARQQADLSIDDSGLILNQDEIAAQQQAAAAAGQAALDDVPVTADTADDGDVPLVLEIEPEIELPEPEIDEGAGQQDDVPEVESGAAEE